MHPKRDDALGRSLMSLKMEARGELAAGEKRERVASAALAQTAADALKTGGRTWLSLKPA